MNNYTFIEVENQNKLGIIRLNRPDMLNAFNKKMLEEISSCIELLNKKEDLRVILIKGNGKSFCTGADLNWIHQSSSRYKENHKDALTLTKCLSTIYNSFKPIIGLGHGSIFGGGIGLLAACDLSYADQSTQFSFNETRLGIVPACISPFIVKRIGETKAKEFMLTGRNVSAIEAGNAGLINKVLPEDQMNDYILSVVSSICMGKQQAIGHTKRVIMEVSDRAINKKVLNKTAKIFTKSRFSKEGKEGISTFLKNKKSD